jgi:hypothetical protein
MATTRIIPLHIGKGRTVATALGLSVDYVENPEKTEGGEWVTAYGCDPLTVDAEFMFSKSQYALITGRNQGDKDVIAYHLRISFKPGETDAETANHIGYDLAMKLTKGRNAFVCCTHTDKEHIHSHIVINSTNIDCAGKFRNFKGSSFAIRKIADYLCLENGLSIIEKPKPSRGSYANWQGDTKPPTKSDTLRDLIDNSLCVGNQLQDFFTKMKRAGCEIKAGKHLAFKVPGGKKFIRLDSLGDGYSETDVRARLRGTLNFTPKVKIAEPPKASRAPMLLIDIEAKIQHGYGAGFENYAKIQNLKEAAKTLIFLKENGIGTYEELVKKDSDVTADYFKRNERRKEIDARLADITELQKHIGNYGKGQSVYNEYRAIKNQKKAQAFYEEHRAALTLRSAAKKYFDGLGLKKLPSINSLKQEYATLLAEKKSLGDIKAAREDMVDWARAKHNVDIILGEPAPARKKSLDRDAR